MKRILCALALIVTINGYAQVNEGSVTYNIEVQGQASAIAGMMGNLQMTLYFKNNRSLMNLTSSMFSTKTLVSDSGVLMLADAMGQKFYFKVPNATLIASDTLTPEIEYTKETKEIAGYTCNKAIIRVKTSDSTIQQTIWYTDKLPPISFGNNQLQLKGLKGLPLQYEMNVMQLQLKLTAQKVSTDPVPDSTFMLSTDGYQEMDIDKMKEAQGVQM